MVRAVADAGADAVEIGIPFSDPVMDGRTIQEASSRALDLGATPAGVIADARDGRRRRAARRDDVLQPGRTSRPPALRGRAGRAGVDGAIVPDLPLDELDGWGDAADEAGVETVLLAGPTTPDERLAAICERSHGFVYGVALHGCHRRADQPGQHALRWAAAARP